MSQAVAAAAKPAGGQFVKVADIEEDPRNARLVFDKEALASLAGDIEATKKARPESGGLLYAVKLRPNPEAATSGKPWRLIDGARRFRAIRDNLGWDEIRAEVEDLDDQAAAVAAASANLQRADLSPLEEARAIQTLLDVGGLNKKQVCAKYGMAFNTLQARLDLLQLPEEVARRVGTDGFTNAHAKLLAPFTKHPEALKVALGAMELSGAEREAGEESLTVEQARIRMVEDLLEAKLVINVDEASGLRYAYGGPEKQRREQVRKDTGAFLLEGASRHGGDVHLALNTPDVKQVVSTAKKHEQQLRKKREAQWSYKPETKEQKAAREEREKLERSASDRATQARGQALLQSQSKLTAAHLVEAFAPNWHNDLGVGIIAKHLGLESNHEGKLKKAVEEALGKLPLEEAARMLLTWELSRAREYDGNLNAIAAKVTGKKWSDWLAEAKRTIESEAKAAKAAKKPAKAEKPTGASKPASKAAKKPQKAAKGAAKAKAGGKKKAQASPGLEKAKAKLAEQAEQAQQAQLE